jgi:hypothetical protein
MRALYTLNLTRIVVVAPDQIRTHYGVRDMRGAINNDRYISSGRDTICLVSRRPCQML